MRWKTFLLSYSLLLSIGGNAQQRRCSDAQAQRAEMQATTLRSWDALHSSYALYRHCDDGAIAEGYSESVARILVDHWRTLPRIAQLARKDSGFKQFVLSHIDATLNTTDAEKVKRNAQTQCPSGLRAICTELANRVDSAATPGSSP